MDPQEITFLRKRDYRFVRELGNGAFGKTYLLHDPEIDENVVCKKYAPASEQWRAQFFKNFINEAKVLYRLYHPNVVRIFTNHIYRDHYAGFLVMEYVEGTDLHSHLEKAPESIARIFEQTISGFRRLEEHQILHRDIRPENILVRVDGVVKIIDFGFGKQVFQPEDFDRSVSLNWWCDTPSEFARKQYDFATEVYFVGMLFQGAIRDHGIDEFPYLEILARMCQRDPAQRVKSFVEVDQAVSSTGLAADAFSPHELSVYRDFSTELANALVKFEASTRFVSDAAKVELQLDQVYRACMLEVTVPDGAHVFGCFMQGRYTYRTGALSVANLKAFVGLLRSCNRAKKNIILSNLQTKLNARPRYEESLDEDVPF